MHSMRPKTYARGKVEERVVDSLFFQCISMSGETINNEGGSLSL